MSERIPIGKGLGEVPAWIDVESGTLELGGGHCFDERHDVAAAVARVDGAGACRVDSRSISFGDATDLQVLTNVYCAVRALTRPN